MSDTDLHRVANWVISRSLDGASETELLEGICSHLRDVGVEVSRAMAIVDTLHPVYEGRAFRTRNDGVEESTVIEYRATSSGPAADNWRSSAFYYLFTTGESQVRRRIAHGDPLDFNSLEQLRKEGQTDYVA
ncbi:MAG: adenylate/guanylate cyclase domain-containing protein, partial [Candidatus Binatia bacterium]